MSKRKQTEDFIIKYIDKIAPGGENKKLYEDLFKSMNNAEFEEFMTKLRDDKITLSVLAPNDSKINLDPERNIKIAKELGYDFFQRLIIGGENPYVTPNKYMVMRLPYRRAAQLLVKKISIPVDNSKIDLSTGQVTGESKSAKLTMPELQILAGIGIKDSVVELMKYRGGDVGGRTALTTLLSRQGSVSQKILKNYATGVMSTKTLKNYLTASHLKSNLTSNQ